MLFNVSAYCADTLNVIFTGDILLDRGVRRVINHHGVDHLFSDGIDSVFRSAQIVVGNLECPATKIEAPVFKQFIFRAEPEWLEALKRHGITHLNLANNHSIDQGREGLTDTYRNILAAGMVPLGAGENMQQAAAPILLASEPRNVWLVPSLRLALENYAYLPDKPCVSQEPMDSLLERIYRLRQADSTAVIIVSLHWGGEHTLEPVPRQRYDAHMLIHAGADALICHHTHTLQTVEDYHGHKIYYSIGNFIFDPTKPLNARACIVRLTITDEKDGLRVETIPINIQQCVPKPHGPQATPDPATVTDSATVMALPLKKHPWTAAAAVTALNTSVQLYNRYLSKEDFAQTTMRTIHRNLRTGLVWDNDKFIMNMFAHPYHGNLYFNVARSNGLNFWESAPYALGGSLMWELFGEKDPPAINDVITTTMGGVAIGEITHRVSDIVLDDRQRGFGRFLREAAAFLINPMKGFSRIARGDAWKVKSTHYKYHDNSKWPVNFSMSAGWRYLADKGKLSGGESNPFLDLFLVYGHAVDGEKHTTPYDFFDVDITFGLSSNQPLINDLHIVGRLWSTPILDKPRKLGEFGIYQHYNYYDSRPVIDGSDQTPYRISEPAALGPGFIFEAEKKGFVSKLQQRLFINAILLGGTKSDYFNVLERDYNMGSGFSIKSKTHLEFGNWARADLHVKYFRIFTWRGYKKSELKREDLHYLNVQGDKGNSGLFVVTPIVEVDLMKHCSLTLSGTYYHRNTRYEEHSDKESKTFETKAGLTYYF